MSNNYTELCFHPSVINFGKKMMENIMAGMYSQSFLILIKVKVKNWLIN